MKCYECGSLCITQYYYGPSHGELNPKIKAVGKICEKCGWTSHPTKIPEPID